MNIDNSASKEEIERYHEAERTYVEQLEQLESDRERRYINSVEYERTLGKIIDSQENTMDNKANFIGDPMGLDAAETEAMKAIADTMEAIRYLFNDTPANWVNEGIPAIHVLQGFVKQHYCNRMNPYWSDWTDTNGD